MRGLRPCVLGCVLLAFGFFPYSLSAQNGPSSATPLTRFDFDQFTVEGGLSHNFVTSILQDRRGYMWFGTEDGLNRYDGYRFTKYRYDPANPSSLSHNYVVSLFEDRSGILWISTDGGGLNRFDPELETFTHYRNDPANPSSLSHDNVRVLFQDSQDILWIGTDGGGLNRFEPETGNFTRYRHDNSIPSSLTKDRITAIREDNDGMLWIGTYGGGLNRFDRVSGRFSRYRYDPDKSSINYVLSLHFSRFEPKVLWVGTPAGIDRIDLPTGQFTRYRNDSANPLTLRPGGIRTFYEDRDGVLWIGTGSGGLSRLDNTTGQFIPHELDRQLRSVPGSFMVSAAYEDRSGVFWIATKGEGLYRLNRSHDFFSRYQYSPENPKSLGYPQVWSILEDREGFLWISTRGGWSMRKGGLDRLDRRTGQFKHYRYDPDDPSSFSHPFAGVIYEDESGMLWAGTDGGGLVRFDRETGAFKQFVPQPGVSNSLGGNQVKALLELTGQPGILWVGLDGGGLDRYDTRAKTISNYRHNANVSSSLSSNVILSLVEARTLPGILWIGTWHGGLDRFDPESGQFKNYRNDSENPNSLSSNVVSTIHASRADPNVLWIGTYGGGLNRFDRRAERFTRFRETDGLASDVVNGILEDDRGFLWISTEVGLSRFDPRSTSFRNFDIRDGLQDNRFFQNTRFRSRLTGEMFFGGANGFNVFHPDSIRDEVYIPDVVLTGLRLSDKPVEIGTKDSPLNKHIASIDELVLSHTVRDITFEYAALHYAAPEKNRYRYRLEGYDEDWIDAGNDNEATYTKLFPGTYTFRVIGAARNGDWNQIGASVHVTIRPPWWSTGWFRFFAAFFVVLLVYAGHRARFRRIKAHRILLEHEVTERTAEVEQQSARLEAQNRELEDSHKHIAEQSRKLQELDALKSRFFINISHEFRTPLTLILGPLHDAIQGAYGPAAEPLRRQFRIMQRNAKRLRRLINQLLDLSKLEAGSMTLHARRTDLIALLKGIVLSFASMAERKYITLQFSAKLETCSLYIEPDKIEKIFTNLLSNAFKFTPKGGHIRVECRDSMGENEGDQNNSGWIEIAVQDTGVGIPSDQVPYVFDRFHQVETDTTPVHEGTGIGLALARELVELHGGTIELDSAPGEGTTFIVRLRRGTDHLDPNVLRDTLEPEQEDVEPTHFFDELSDAETEVFERTTPGEDAPTVLIVEDNFDVRAYVREHLTPSYHVVEAADGFSGLETARAVIPDLIISDVMMPKMDGYALCRAIKADPALNHIPVVLLTARASEESKVEGLETGADDYIYKPFNAAELLTRVENLIEIRRTLRNRFSREVITVQASNASIKSADRVFLERTQEVVEAHLADGNFSVNWLADEMALSPRQLQRKLKALTNLSAAGYIRTLRLQRAAQELEQQSGTVAEVAYRVGFQDAEYFSRLFRQVYGVLPSKFPQV